MILARVTGHATSTICHQSLHGVRLILCEPLLADGSGAGRFLLCGDWQGAGIGDKVLITADGEAATRHTGRRDMPMRNVIVGILDKRQPETVLKESK